MTLAPGARLGPYEIVAPLGAGGMGEVYRARDTRLGRDVAVKVLPEHLSGNPDLRARFEREARTVSSLNHPHICTLHDIGREGDTDYLVMELVEGVTLADRIARGPVPAAEALTIGIQVADALDRAHRAGIVHRDLKPGNIMLARGGAKLMDFGLARATALPSSAGSLTQSPTMTRPLTTEGAIVGTFQYMAPEQLEGGEADARCDLWALGVTLYEMLTGRKAFTGRSSASLIASILKEQPANVSQVQPLVPPAFDQLIRACLAKDPEERIQTAHDVKLQLQWIAEGGSQAGVPAPVAARRRSRETLAWTLAAVAFAGLVALGVLAWRERPQPPRMLRYRIEATSGEIGVTWPRVSPDGRLLAYVAKDSAGTTSIWVRPFDALEGRRLPGTEGVVRPFWSPDSRFLAYFIGGRLYKVPVAGGPPLKLAETRQGSDGSWGTQGTILFDAGLTDSIFAIPEAGGSPRPVTRLDRRKGETNHAWPYFLPDGKHFVFVAYAGSNTSGTIELGELGSDRLTDLGATDGRVEFAPPGWLVFPREGSLLAQHFDLGAGKLVGDASPIGENVVAGVANGYFSVSPSGTLTYMSGMAHVKSQVEWFDRNGRSLGVLLLPAEYRDLALSPDGSQLAMSVVDPASGHEAIWVRQLARGVTTRLTFGGGDAFNPTWSADGQRLAYTSSQAGMFRTYFRNVNGVGGEDSLASLGAGPSGPTGWSPDGRTLAVRYRDPKSNWDVYLVPVGPGAKPAPFASTPAAEQWATYSPDGRWIAYASSQSGRPEVFVQAADGSGGKWQVSTNGGTRPWWRPDGREILYTAIDNTLMGAAVQPGATFQVGATMALFRSELANGTYDGRRWSPTADATRILVNTPVEESHANGFIVVSGWASDLAKK